MFPTLGKVSSLNVSVLGRRHWIVCSRWLALRLLGWLLANDRQMLGGAKNRPIGYPGSGYPFPAQVYT